MSGLLVLARYSKDPISSQYETVAISSFSLMVFASCAFLSIVPAGSEVKTMREFSILNSFIICFILLAVQIKILLLSPFTLSLKNCVTLGLTLAAHSNQILLTMMLRDSLNFTKQQNIIHVYEEMDFVISFLSPIHISIGGRFFDAQGTDKLIETFAPDMKSLFKYI